MDTGIVILEVETKKLDKNKLFPDENYEPNFEGDGTEENDTIYTYEYHGIVDPKNIK